MDSHFPVGIFYQMFAIMPNTCQAFAKCCEKGLPAPFFGIDTQQSGTSMSSRETSLNWMDLGRSFAGCQDCARVEVLGVAPGKSSCTSSSSSAARTRRNDCRILSPNLEESSKAQVGKTSRPSSSSRSLAKLRLGLLARAR